MLSNPVLLTQLSLKIPYMQNIPFEFFSQTLSHSITTKVRARMFFWAFIIIEEIVSVPTIKLRYVSYMTSLSCQEVGLMVKLRKLEKDCIIKKLFLFCFDWHVNGLFSDSVVINAASINVKQRIRVSVLQHLLCCCVIVPYMRVQYLWCRFLLESSFFLSFPELFIVHLLK